MIFDSVLNKLTDTIIRFEDVRLPVTYCDEETNENEFKYRFYIETDDSDFITNVRRRKNNFLKNKIFKSAHCPGNKNITYNTTVIPINFLVFICLYISNQAFTCFWLSK